MINLFLTKVRNKINLPKAIDTFFVTKFPTIFFCPHMTFKEFKLLKKYSGPAKNIVEFGSGGSTIYFLNKNKFVASVENHKPFFEFLNTLSFIKSKKRERLLDYNFVDIGETTNWGELKKDSTEKDVSSYYQSVWEKTNIKNPDLIFVDGRFRVMCTLNSIPYINDKTIIVIHDFWNRKHYSCILEFFEPVDRVDTMVILKLKDNIDKNKLKEVKKDYCLDQR